MMLIRNTSGDRRKVTQHRTASALQPEPSIGGARLRAGQQMYIEDDHFARIRDSLYKSFKDGVIEVEPVQVKEGENIRVGVPMESTKKEHTNLHGASGIGTPQIKADDENEVTPVLPKGPVNLPPAPEITDPDKKKEWEDNQPNQPPQQPQEQSSGNPSWDAKTPPDGQHQSEKQETNTEGQAPTGEGQESSDKPENEKHEKHRSGKKSR